jgi:diaminopimelate epimerase
MVSTGNKHLILPIEDVESLDELTKRHTDCNLHFIKYIDKQSIRLKTFERGVGWTMACGSGAVAVAFLSGIQGKIHIVHDGGISTVEVLDDSVTLTTAPQLVFEGVMYGEA